MTKICLYVLGPLAIATLFGAHADPCTDDERVAPTGFIAAFLDHFRHHASPAELNRMDRDEAYARKEDLLYYIVHDKCLRSKRDGRGSGQCHVVDEGRGCAILQPPGGHDHFLAVPLKATTGIEDPGLLSEDSKNYFACAWAHRNVLGLGRAGPPARGDFAMAINSVGARSLDQLHIHMGCVTPALAKSLRESGPSAATGWSSLGRELRPDRGTRFMKIQSSDLVGIDPFRLLGQDLGAHGKSGSMENHALTVVGATFDGDKPGFYLVDQWDDSGYRDQAPSGIRNLGACPAAG